jgi:hypothetical protein
MKNKTSKSKPKNQSNKRENKTQVLNLALWLSLITHLTTSEILITSPINLERHFNSYPLKYSLANFGDIPYGHIISGSMVMAIPADGCTPLTNKLLPSQSILLVERGGCHFAEKVLNAQLLGIKFVLVMDDIVEDVADVLPVEHGFHIMSLVLLSFYKIFYKIKGISGINLIKRLKFRGL